MQDVKHIAIVVGETSGDILAAGLLRELKQRYPNATFSGIGGPRMLAQGFDSLFDMEELSVMGLFEVLSRLRRLLHIRKSLSKHFIANPPDVFIGVDAPDFNLGLELTLKQAGIKTVQYVSPTVWAWRQKRIFKIARATNLVLSIFPFEKAFYEQHQVPCEFVGHTLADQLPLQPDVAAARLHLGLPAQAAVLAILPGSRGNEVGLLSEPFFRAAALMQQQQPDLHILIPAANAKRRAQIEAVLAEVKLSNVQVLDGQSREAMTAADAILLASGTATLEAMLCKKPMLVAYKFSPLTAMILRRLVKADYFSLPNLLAGKKLVQELLQEQVEPDRIATELSGLLAEPQTALLAEFTAIHQQLKCNADVQAAQAIEKLLEAPC
ncbi:lipid-A-disaccharide synthase [Bowmanella sp. JS7-9]|uniref:Lipid-A-disaccharide synthase n=1 Tax=Pseudobowmanella zhangzhouensis TaxID=1537679 RepID=A0ABW1XHD4_9ALTE|nr:lipid-A-disaccharide synthase [Bowmanella sp. JS7-9]